MISGHDLQNSESERQLLQIQIIDLETLIMKQREELIVLKLKLADLGLIKSEIELLDRISLDGGESSESIPSWQPDEASTEFGKYLKARQTPTGQENGYGQSIAGMRSEIAFLQSEILELQASIKSQQSIGARLTELQSELELVTMERDNYRYELEILLKELKQKVNFRDC